MAVKSRASLDDAADVDTSALLVCTWGWAARASTWLACARLSPSWTGLWADPALGTSADSSWTPLALDVGGVEALAAGAALLDDAPVPVCVEGAERTEGAAARVVEVTPADGTGARPPPGSAPPGLVKTDAEVDGAAGAANAQLGEVVEGPGDVQVDDGTHQGVVLDGTGEVVSWPGAPDDGAPPGVVVPAEGCDVVGDGVVADGGVGAGVVGTGCEADGDDDGDDGCEEVGVGDATGLLLAGALVGVLVGTSAGVDSRAGCDGGASCELVVTGLGVVVPGVVVLGVVVLGVAESSERAAGELLDAAPLDGVFSALDSAAAVVELAEEVLCGSSAWATRGIPSTPRAASPTAPRARALRAAAGVTGGVQGRRAWRCPVGVVIGADPRRRGAAGESDARSCCPMRPGS